MGHFLLIKIALKAVIYLGVMVDLVFEFMNTMQQSTGGILEQNGNLQQQNARVVSKK